MPTAFTQAELDEMKREVEGNMPPDPSPELMAAASEIISLNAAGGNSFMMLALVDNSGNKETFILTPPAAMWLHGTIYAGARGAGWTDERGKPIVPGSKPAAPEPSKEEKAAWNKIFRDALPESPGMIEIFRAPAVLSMSAGGSMEGLVLSLKLRAGEVRHYFLNAIVAVELFVMIGDGAANAGWLGSDGKLLPKTALN